MPRRGIDRVPTGDGSELFAMAMENGGGGEARKGKKGDKKDEKEEGESK